MLIGRKLHETKLEVEGITKKAFVEAMWKTSERQLPLPQSHSRNKVAMKSAMEHKYRDVQFLLDALAGSLVVLTAEEDHPLRRHEVLGRPDNGES